jgi:hypothetical protein
MKSQISLLKFSKPWSTEQTISIEISVVVVRSVIKALELDEDVVIHLYRQHTFSPLINKISVMKVLRHQPQTRFRGLRELDSGSLSIISLNKLRVSTKNFES